MSMMDRFLLQVAYIPLEETSSAIGSEGGDSNVREGALSGGNTFTNTNAEKEHARPKEQLLPSPARLKGAGRQ